MSESSLFRGRSLVLLFTVLMVLCAASRLAPAVKTLAAGYQPTSDEAQYLRLSSNLIKGRGLSDSTAEPYLPSASRGPVYPLFLAAIGKVKAELWLIRVMQACLEILAGALLAFTAWKLAGGRSALLVLALWTVLGPTQAFIPYFYSETLAGFIAVASACLLLLLLHGERYAWLAWPAGLSLGLLVLTRPAQVVWLPLTLVILLLAVRHKKLKAAALWLCLLGMVLPMGTWFIRNVTVLKRPVLLTTIGSGMNLWVGTQSAGTEVMDWVVDGQGRGRWVPAIPFGDSDEERRRAANLWNTYMENLLRGGDMKVVEEADAGFKALALERWKRKPGEIIIFRVANGMRSLVPTDLPLPAWLQLLLGALLWGLSLVWGRWAWRHRHWGLLWCMTCAWLLWAAHLPLHTESRYLYPAWPLILLGLACWTGLGGKAQAAVGDGDPPS